MATEFVTPSFDSSLTELSSRFRQLEARIRRVAVLRGLGWCVFATAIACAVGLLLDWFWPISGTLRSVWLVATLGIFGWTFATGVLRPLFQRFRDEELAAIVEAHYPELGERLTSTVELQDPNIPESEKGSALMRDYITAETVASTDHLDFQKAITTERAQKSAWFGGMAILVLLLPFVLIGSAYGTLWSRLLLPWGNHAVPAQLYFEVTDLNRVVARGEDVMLMAFPPRDTPTEDLPELVELVRTSPTGETDRRPMTYTSEQRGFAVTLPHVLEGFEYIVVAPRKRSERGTIEVVDRPEILETTLTILPPKYTGLPENVLRTVTGDVLAFEGSRLRTELRFNKPLAKADWIWQPADRSEKSTALPFELSEDQRSAVLEWDAQEGWFSLQVSDEHDLTNPEDPARKIVLLKDQPPKLELSGQIGTTRARADDAISIIATATDDFGISALEMEIETSQEHTETRPVPMEILGPNEVGHTFALDVSAFDLAAGDWVKYRVRAADNRPDPEPQEVWSEERRIVIDPDADLPGSEEVLAQQNTLRAQLDALLTDIKRNRGQIETLQKQAADDNATNKPFAKTQELATLEREQRDAMDRLEALALEFGKHKLFANLKEDMQHIAREEIATAADKSQQAARSAEAAGKPLEESAQALTQAEEKLQSVSDRFDELAALERDLLVLPRLAQQAERVANEALDLTKRQKEASPKPEEANLTPEEKSARDAELSEKQNELEQERQRLADAIDRLLEHRPEVLAAARKDALEQIAELSQQAAALADRQDSLNELLKTDVETTIEKAAPIADQQEALIKKTETKPAVEANEPQSEQVSPVDPEELKKVLEDLKAGNLEAAENRQNAIANRLEALAEELKKNRSLPDDPKKAAEELAKRQRDLAKKFAETAAKQPGNNATPAEQQAFKNSLKELAERQTGIQAGIAELDSPAPNREQHNTAANHAAEAVKHATEQKPEDATKSAQAAADALEQLAKNTKTQEERQAAAKKAVETLRKDQQQLRKDVAKSLKQNDKTPPELAERQENIAEQLAGLDVPRTEDSKARDEAVKKAARAMTDLENNRQQDANASQERTEQALADLAKSLDGKPTAEADVESLQKQQEEIANQTKDAADKNTLPKQAEAQQQIGKDLESLDTPAAEPERRTAENAAKAAANELQKATDSKAIQAALEKSRESLDRLAKALNAPPQQNAAEQAEQLAKRQQQAAKSANVPKTPPTKADRNAQQDQLAELQKDTERLPVGNAAETEKAEALEALEKAAKAGEQLEELIKKNEQSPPPANNPQAKQDAKEELQRLTQENAQAQQDAADALQRLEQKLGEEKSQETLDQEQNEVQEKAEELAKTNEPKPPPQSPELPKAEDVEQLAEEARAVEEDIRKLQQERQAANQVADAEPTSPQSEKNPQPGQNANPQSTQPESQSNENNPRAEGSKPNTQEVNASDPKNSESNASEPNNSNANGSDPKDSAANPSDPKQSPAPAETPNTQAGIQDPTAAPGDQKPNTKQSSETSSQAANTSRPKENSLAEKQAELARDAAKLAMQISEEHGAQSSAGQDATKSAKQSATAQQAAKNGTLDEAAKSAKDAADAATSTAQELAKAEENTGEPSPLAKSAKDHADAQKQLAEEFAEAANDPNARRAAQQAGQQSLAKSATDLAKALEDAARSLSSNPLDLEQPGEKTASAGKAAQDAAQAMQNAADSAQRGNSTQAADSGKAASEALRKAAGESPAPPESTPENSLVPSDLARQVAEARRHLEEARQQLQKSSPGENAPSTPMANANDAGQPSNKPNAQTSQNPSDSKATNPGQNSPGSQQQSPNGKPGQQPSPQSQGLAQSAKSLQQAAKTLAQAAGQMQGGVPGQANAQNGSQSQSQNAGTPQSGGEGAGSNTDISIEELEAELARQNREEWGQLPGQLRTEILQGSKKRTQGDYAKLIRLYSEELLKKQQASPPQ